MSGGGRETAGRRNGPKRRRILDAASRLFGGRDLARVRMEEVAEQAGVAKGTLYNYFASKEDLYFSILIDRMDHLLKALSSAFRQEGDAPARVRKFAVHALMFLVKYPDFFRMLRKEESGSHAGGSAETSRLRARLRALLRDLIEEGRGAGQIEAVDPARAADWVLGAIEGAALGYIETGEKPERGSIELDRFVAFVWGGLARVPASMGILAGRRILVTREERPREGLSREIERLGGRAVLCPLVRTLPPRDEAALERAARQAAAFDWILFTSVRGVEAFSRARGRRACPIPESARLGAVGEATAEAARRRFGRVDLVAPLAGGAGLAAALIDRSPLSGCRVLLPRAELGHPDLPRLLREQGARVEEVAAYRTVPVEAVPEEIPGLLANGEIAAVAFASGSAVEAFAALFGAGALRREGRRFAVVSIGGSTSAKVESLGGRVDAEADQPSLEHLARAAAAGLESRAAAAGAAGPAAIRREETYR